MSVRIKVASLACAIIIEVLKAELSNEITDLSKI